MFYIFVENGIIVGSGEVPLVNENLERIEVTEEIYNKYNQDHMSVIWDSETNEVIDNPYYEEIVIQRRKDEFHKEFFLTSVGYIRRTATMKDGKQKDFITDLIPLMQDTPNVPVIAYREPDFTQEITDEILISLQVVVISTPQLIKECKTQAIIDFYGYNPIELLNMQQGEPTIEDEHEEEIVPEVPEQEETTEEIEEVEDESVEEEPAEEEKEEE